MLTPYLICFPLSLVAANPILQRIPIQIPAQSWPTQPSTCPTQTCPNTSQPTLCQTCQNSYRNLLNYTPVVRQPNPVVPQPNNYACSQPGIVQNAVASQPVNQELLSQLILRRLLSSQPQLQNPVQPGPVKVCNQCEEHKAVPNIINNYIIIPPEYFKANETNNEDTVSRKRKGKRRKQNRPRKQRPECPCNDKVEQNNDDKVKIEDKINNGEHVTLCLCEEDTFKSPDATKEQNGELKEKLITEKNNDKTQAEGINDAERKEISQKSIENCQGAVSRKTECTENKPVETEKPKRKNRERSKSIEEAIIKDFCKRNPTIPEEIARLLLKKLIHQVESQEKSHYGTYPPYSPYSPFGFNEFNPSMFYPPNHGRDRARSDRGPRRRKPHHSGRRNKKPKEVIKENCDNTCKKLVELNPTVINIETETITTEKIIATTENKQKENVPLKDSETQMETPEDLINQLEQMKAKFAKLNEIETTTVNHNKRMEIYPELGREDKVPTVYDNAVDDDYYPDFRNDNFEFYACDEEQDIKDDRYHYTTDKNGGYDPKRYVTKKQSNTNDRNCNLKYSNNDKNSNEYTLPIPTESYESYEESIKDESEEIRFRVPPHLELPDFETKQINRLEQEINDEFVADDYTLKSYSDGKAESRPNIEMNPAKVFTKDKTGRTNIETVFGHSRVVKYGQDAEGAASDPVITYYLPEEAMTEDRIQLPDGEMAVVVAKSIRDLVDDWE